MCGIRLWNSAVLPGILTSFLSILTLIQSLNQISLLIGIAATSFPIGSRGTLYLRVAALYAGTSPLAGFSSSMLYKKLGGTQITKNILTTAILLPLPVFLMILASSVQASSSQITFGLQPDTLLLLAEAWVVIVIPLIAFGAISGRLVKKGEFLPASENRRPASKGCFCLLSLSLVMLSGFVSLVSSYIELSFLFDGLWGYSNYNLYGTLFFSFFLLSTSSCNF